MTKPIYELLPLPVDEDIKSFTNFLYEALHELVCFGTHILAWSLEKGSKTEPGTEIDLAVPLVFRHILELTDSISVQVQNGVIAPCRIQMRALLEASFSLEYLLEKDRHRRAASFLIVDYYRKLNFSKKLVHDSKENIKLREDLKKYGYLMTELKEVRVAERMSTNMQSLINKTMYKEVKDEYLRLTSQNTKNLEIKWYNLFSNHSSVSWLAKHLGRYDLYEFMYRDWSNPMHGTNLYSGVLVKGDDGLGALTQLRNTTEAQKVTATSMFIIINLYSMMSKKVVSEHRLEYAAWHIYYKEAFRDKLDSMK